MTVYILILLILLVLVINYDINRSTLGYKISYIIMLVLFVCVSGLRYKIGSDTLSYMEEYKYLPNISQLFKSGVFDTRYDFLWVVFCAVCKSISDSFFFMQFLHALIINSIYFYFIYNNTKYRFTAIFLYYVLGFLYFNTEILRESTAIAIFLLSISSYYRKNWLRYYVLGFFSFLFHSSALIVIVFPFLSKIKFNKAFILSLLIVMIMAGLVWQLFSTNIDLFFIVASIESKSRAYLNNETYVSNFNGMVYGLITYMIVPLLAVFFHQKYLKTNVVEAPFIWVYLAIGIFIVYNNTIFTRFQNYLFFPFILFLSNLIIESYRRRRKILFHTIKVTGIFVLLIVGKYYNYFKPDITQTTYIYQRYIPYHSILTKETTRERELLDYYW
jgi:hypothetical protein